VVQLSLEDGAVLGWFEARDSSGAFVVPDANGRLYLTLSSAANATPVRSNTFFGD